MIKRLSILSLLTLLSLLPAVLLFLLFGELNSAGVTLTGGKAVQLGGPTAVFFIALTLLWQMYKYMLEKDNPLESKLQNLIGLWKVESTSGSSGREAVSETTIEFDDGQLLIGGGTFFDVGKNGTKGDPIGEWSVDIAVSDGRRIRYFYSLKDSIASRTWKGVAEMTYQSDPAPSLYGTWQVTGKEYHSGKITMTKK